jgi:hypothetical protein
MKYTIRIIISVICCLSLIGSAITSFPPSVTTSVAAEEKIETWAAKNPRAASDLGTWVNAYKEAAHQLFKWDSGLRNKLSFLLPG